MEIDLQCSAATEIELRRHETPEGIIREHWSFADPDVFQHADELILGGSEEDGADFMFSPNAMLEGIKRQGLWGFADCSKRIVHFWASSIASREDIVECLAHEIGHLSGTPEVEHIAEERRADSYGLAARMALKWSELEFPSQQGMRLHPAAGKQ